MGLTSTILPGSKSVREEYPRFCHNQFACFQSTLNLNVCQLKFGQLEVNLSVHLTLVSPFISMCHEFAKKVFLRQISKWQNLKSCQGKGFKYIYWDPFVKRSDGISSGLFWPMVQTKWTCLSQGGGLVKYAAAAKPPFFSLICYPLLSSLTSFLYPFLPTHGSRHEVPEDIKPTTISM